MSTSSDNTGRLTYVSPFDNGAMSAFLGLAGGLCRRQGGSGQVVTLPAPLCSLFCCLLRWQKGGCHTSLCLMSLGR